MNLKRALAVSKRVFMDLRNDRRTLALIIVAPIFAMTVFGLAFSGDVQNVNVIVVNQDRGAALPVVGDVSFSDGIIAHLDTETLAIREMTNLIDAIESVEDGNAYAIIFFPEDFTVSALNTTTNIRLYIDMSNVNVAEAIAISVSQAILGAMEDLGQTPPISVDRTAIYGQNAEFMDFFVPGIMCFVVYLITTLLTLITFVGERASGTLSRLLATPLRESEIVTGYAITFSIVGTLQAALLLTIGIVVFNISVVGNVLLAFAVIALLAIVCQALGILLSALADREAQAIQLLPFVVLPAILLSGVFWPIEAIPVWLQPASYLIPPSYAIDACRSVMLRGWGLDMVWHDIVALLIFAVIFLGLAALSLKRRK